MITAFCASGWSRMACPQLKTFQLPRRLGVNAGVSPTASTSLHACGRTPVCSVRHGLLQRLRQHDRDDDH